MSGDMTSRNARAPFIIIALGATPTSPPDASVIEMNADLLSSLFFAPSLATLAHAHGMNTTHDLSDGTTDRLPFEGPHSQSQSSAPPSLAMLDQARASTLPNNSPQDLANIDPALLDPEQLAERNGLHVAPIALPDASEMAPTHAPVAPIALPDASEMAPTHAPVERNPVLHTPGSQPFYTPSLAPTRQDQLHTTAPTSLPDASETAPTASRTKPLKKAVRWSDHIGETISLVHPDTGETCPVTGPPADGLCPHCGKPAPIDTTGRIGWTVRWFTANGEIQCDPCVRYFKRNGIVRPSRLFGRTRRVVLVT